MAGFLIELILMLTLSIQVSLVGSMLQLEHLSRPSARRIEEQCSKARMMVRSRDDFTDPNYPDFQSLQLAE